MPDNLKKIYNWSLLKPVSMGLLVFLLLCSLCGFLSYLRYQLLKNEERQAAHNVAESAKERLQQSLQYSLSATQALALTIKDKMGSRIILILLLKLFCISISILTHCSLCPVVLSGMYIH